MSFADAAIYVVAAAAIAGAGTAAYSASAQADANKSAANYQAAVAANEATVAQNNAKLAANQRSLALQDTQASAEKSLRDTAGFIGKQRASLAANGVDVTEGSATDLIASSKFLNAQDVSTIQSNAAREAWGYDVQGANYKNQAQAATGQSAFDKWKADSISPAAVGAIAGGSSLLSSASSYAATRIK